ncbi:hypothetical protein SCP_0406220 [Sparassis crispa]|uniref:Uncharacterized protein n=1 Tax=Sparassis crispa TaxID=139825 RepID=A0A401GJ86_9APHY|nr:hypothetical protein SCP_0406220 [Sparassis crispa]GBE82238.1 hypothetical protein SCP_0406220 [Sparassis crispa]
MRPVMSNIANPSTTLLMNGHLKESGAELVRAAGDGDEGEGEDCDSPGIPVGATPCEKVDPGAVVDGCLGEG